MHRLAPSFVLGFDGCDREVGEGILKGAPFKVKNNSYDWLGHGDYIWESDPRRGLHFAYEWSRFKRRTKITDPFVLGAVIELGLCLDMTTQQAIADVLGAYKMLVATLRADGKTLPTDSGDRLRRHWDCPVIQYLHAERAEAGEAPIDTVKGIFLEGEPIYPGGDFYAKTQTQNLCSQPVSDQGRLPLAGGVDQRGPRRPAKSVRRLITLQER